MLTENLIPASEFCVHHNIEVSFIHSLEDYGLIETTIIDGTQFIESTQVGELEKLVRLHYELNVNLEGIDVINYLLQQLAVMNTELMEIKNRLRFYESTRQD